MSKLPMSTGSDSQPYQSLGKLLMTSGKDLCYTQYNGCLEIHLDYAMMKTWNRKNSEFHLQNLFRNVWYHFKIEIWKQSMLHSCVSLRYTPIQTCSQVHQKKIHNFLAWQFIRPNNQMTIMNMCIKLLTWSHSRILFNNTKK